MSRPSRRLVVAALALAPAGCTSLLPAAGAPPKLYTLTPVADFPPDGARVAWSSWSMFRPARWRSTPTASR